MTEVLFILPKDDGCETPFGEVFRFPCSEIAPVESLFDVIRKRLSKLHVRLSLEVPEAPEGPAKALTMALAAIDPHDSRTVGSAGISGARIIVGF